MRVVCSSLLENGLRWVCGAWCTVVVAWAVPLSSRTLEVQQQELPGPKVLAGSEVSLARAADGSIGLAWVEGNAHTGAGAERARLCFASWDQGRASWGMPVEVAGDVQASARRPVLAKGGAGVVAVALPQSNGWWVWRSADGGGSWSAPVLIAEEASALAMAVLTDGRLLAVWRTGAGEVCSQIVGASERPQEVVRRAIALAEFSVVPMLDGCASLAVWVRDEAGAAGVAVLGFDGETWRLPSWMQRPQAGEDGSRSVTLVADGPLLGAVIGVGSELMCSSSSDGGASWTLAQPCSADLVAGAGGIARLRDGSLYAVWSERMSSQAGGLFLRRYNASGVAMQPALLGWFAGRAGAQAVVLREDSSVGPAQLLVVRVGDDECLVTHVVSLPGAGVLAAMDADCDCRGNAGVSSGYPVKGRMLGVEAGDVPRMRIWQSGVFGLMRAGALTVRISPGSATRLRAKDQFLARLESREGEWWLGDVRLLGAP